MTCGILKTRPTLRIFLFFKASPVFHLACREAQPAGWLSTQRRVWWGCDWQGHGVLSRRFWFRNQVISGNFTGIASSDLNWSCFSNTGMLILFYALFFYSSAILVGRQRGLCYFLVHAIFSSLLVFHHWSISAMPGGWYALEGKNSLQWQRSLLLLFVHLQLPGQRIHTHRGRSNWIWQARAFRRQRVKAWRRSTLKTNSPIQIIKIILRQHIVLAEFLTTVLDP